MSADAGNVPAGRPSGPADRAVAPPPKARRPRRSLPVVVWGIAIPLLFAELSEIILQVTDTLFLARVGIAELGAIALADSIWELFLVLPLGLVDGIQILTGRFLGRRQPRAAGQVFNQGLLLLVTAAVALAAVLAVALHALAPMVAEDAAVAVAVEDYLRLGLLGLPFTAAAFAYSALLVSLGRTRVLIPATILLTVTNLALDWILIFGNLGAPALGIRGAALGSLGAEFVTFAFLTAYLIRLPAARRLRLFRVHEWKPRVIRRLTRLSAPVSAQGAVEAVRWFAFFILIAMLGPVALAVGSVVYACYVTLRIPTEAFAEAACSLTSRLVGRGRPQRIGDVVRTSIGGAFVITAPFLLFALIAPETVLVAFELEPALLDAGAASLRVVALAMLVVVPAEMWFTAVLGTGDTLAALVIEVLLTVALLACVAAGVRFLPGSPEVAWGSLLVAWLVALVASWGWMRSGRWARRTI